MALGHADRSRIAAGAAERWPGDGLHWSPLLVDGFVAGVWRLTGDSRNATLVGEPLERLPEGTGTAVAEEGDRLLAFLAADAGTRQVRVGR